MKTLTEITNTIAQQIGAVANQMQDDFVRDYELIVCPERIFMDEYAPREELWCQQNDELPMNDYDKPTESPFRNTVFVVIKLGSGQRNYAVANSNVTIQVLSEENDFVFARQLLDNFLAEYNFQYQDGFVQAYFTPSMNASQDEVYTGFRALLSCTGFIRVPETGFAFANSISITYPTNDGEKTLANIPFTNVSINYGAQPDPQVFAGTMGKTKALVRKSSTTVSFSTYLSLPTESQTFDSDTAYFEEFCASLIDTMNGHMNNKFRIAVKSATGIVLTDSWFVLVNASYSQELGDIDPWNLSFTEAKRSED